MTTTREYRKKCLGLSVYVSDRELLGLRAMTTILCVYDGFLGFSKYEIKTGEKTGVLMRKKLHLSVYQQREEKISS